MQASKIHSVMNYARTGEFAMDGAKMTLTDVAALSRIGISITPRKAQEMIANMGLDGMQIAQDDLQGPVTTASISNPIQFLQSWLPGLVRIVTAARTADNLMPVVTAGNWEDEEIIQRALEQLGVPALYGDYTNIPLASWNLSFERRSVLRWEKGFQVGALEEARSARMQIKTAAEKRNAAAVSLEVLRNSVAFSGFNGGNNRTYGMLNDPSLPGYVTVPATGTGATTPWANKSFLQITADLRLAAAALQTNGKGVIDPMKTPIVLAVAMNAAQYLSVTSDFGISVSDWIKKTYPNWRIEPVPEFNGANGGANVFYLYAESIQDGGTDGGGVWAQIVPAKFRALGTEKRAKSYLEDFSSALAGVMLKRPFAIVRYSGI